MKTAIIFDCEFLTSEGAQTRFWCGPNDPDPTIVQIGAVKLGLADDFPVLDKFRVYVSPRDRHGGRPVLSPFFSQLTGITEDVISNRGVPLTEALKQLDDFSKQANFWSWGKDELNMLAISCYVENLAPPIPVSRFGNVCSLLVKAGISDEDIKKTRSNRLAAVFGLKHPELRAHDALDDALSVAYALQHLLRNRSLADSDFF